MTSSTAHTTPVSKKEKENIPLVTPRVLFASPESSAVYKYPLRLPATPRHPVALKSILKNTVIAGSVTDQIPKSIPTTMTSELDCETFLSGPLSTLVASLEPVRGHDISLLDISEAYATLSSRLRYKSKLMTAGTRYAALSCIQASMGLIVKALRRDIGCALLTPGQDSKKMALLDQNFRARMTTDEMKIANDHTSVAHGALAFLSDIFKMSAVQSIFSNEDLVILLREVLRIALSPSIPTPNSKKTRILALWILHTQNLPSSVISKARDSFSLALRHAVTGDESGKGKNCPRYYALKVIEEQLKHNQEIFLDKFANLTPYTLPLLVSSNSDVRMQTTLTLGRIALALLSTPTRIDLHVSVSSHVAQYIDSFRRTKSNAESPLVQALKLCLEHKAPTHIAETSAWAISTLSAITILLGPHIFRRPKALKLVVNSLAAVNGHKNTLESRAVPALWKCLAWTYSQLALWPTEGDDAEDQQDFAERCFSLVKQELSGDVGTAMICTILHPTSPHDKEDKVSKALIVLKDMAKSKRQYGAVSSILHRLLSGVGEPRPSREGKAVNIVPSELLNGTMLCSVGDDFRKIVENLEHVPAEHIRILDDAECIGGWDTLLGIWEDCAKAYLNVDAGIRPATLFDSWQAFLLLQAQVSKGGGHLTISPAGMTRITSVMTSFLSHPQTPSMKSRADALMFVRKLWSVLCNVFAPACISDFAKAILNVALTYPCDFTEEATKSAWSGLCADIISVGVPQVLQVVSQTAHECQEIELKRQLWAIAVNHCLSVASGDSDQKSLEFALLLPFGHWVFNSKELPLWEALFRAAMDSSKRSMADRNSIWTAVMSKIIDRSTEKSSVAPQIVSILLTYCKIDGNDREEDGIISLLTLVRDILLHQYPPNNHNLDPCLKLMDVLQALVSRCPGNIVFISKILEKGLDRWIEDKIDVIPDDIYNSKVVSLYCTILQELGKSSPTTITIRDLADFLTSPFSRERIPPPALGPVAFQTFWNSVQSSLNFTTLDCPQRIKTCVRALVDSFGGEIPQWMESESQTGSTHSKSVQSLTSRIPDSPQFRRKSPGKLSGSPHNPNSAMSSPVKKETSSSDQRKPRTTTEPMHSSPQPGISTPPSVARSFSESSSVNKSSNMVPFMRMRDHETSNASSPGKSGSDQRRKFPSPQSPPFPRLPHRSYSLEGEGDDPHGWRPLKRRKLNFGRREEGLNDYVVDNNSDNDDQKPVLATSSAPEGRELRRKKAIFDGVVVPTWKELRLRDIGDQPASVRHGESHAPGGVDAPTSDDYGSWEIGLSSQDAEAIRFELSNDGSESADITHVSESSRGSSPSVDGIEIIENPITHPSVDDLRNAPQRLQSAPVRASTSAVRPNDALRRSRTVSSTHLAVEQLHTVVQSDVLNMETQDLAEAATMINEIAGVLNRQMTRKLGKRSRKE